MLLLSQKCQVGMEEKYENNNNHKRALVCTDSENNNRVVLTFLLVIRDTFFYLLSLSHAGSLVFRTLKSFDFLCYFFSLGNDLDSVVDQNLLTLPPEKKKLVQVFSSSYQH
jgi:hypothetical protein